MIDLHAHILPGLEDGSRDLETSVAMARVAVDDGIRTLVATPRVGRADRATPVAMLYSVGALNVALVRERVPLAVLPGGVIAPAAVASLDEPLLRTFSLGGARSVLLETLDVADLAPLEAAVENLLERRFRPLLAHPERSLAFSGEPDRVAPLVERGVLCALDAGSMTGEFGPVARTAALRLLEESLVHAVCSNARDAQDRAPRLRPAFAAVARELPWLADQADYLTQVAPAAILAGGKLPPRPGRRSRRWRFRRLVRR